MVDDTSTFKFSSPKSTLQEESLGKEATNLNLINSIDLHLKHEWYEGGITSNSYGNQMDNIFN